MVKRRRILESGTLRRGSELKIQYGLAHLVSVPTSDNYNLLLRRDQVQTPSMDTAPKSCMCVHD